MWEMERMEERMIKEGKEEKRIQRKGQITVTLVLVLTVVISLLLSMVEAARSVALEVKMECAAQTALYSLFAQYHKELAEQYDVLFIDSSFGSDEPSVEKMEDILDYYLEQNCIAIRDEMFLSARDWYGITVSDSEIENVRLATDSLQPSFYIQAVSYIRNIINADICEEVLRWNEVVGKQEITPENIEEANRTNIEKVKKQGKVGDDWSITKIYPEYDIMKIFGSKNVLWFTGFERLPSTKSINLLNTYGLRNKNEGSRDMYVKHIPDLLEDVYFNEYILMKLGSYANVKTQGALDYQTEYVICGLPGDSENLMGVCEALFLLRSAMNIIPLVKSEEAKGIIEALSSVVLLFEIPPEVVKPILYMMWAGLEAMVDVQSLLNEERIPLIKEYGDFVISLKGAAESGTDILDENKEQSHTQGLSYADYLRILLLAIPRPLRIVRCMDMVEANIRLLPGNEFFRIDGCVDAIEVNFSLETSFGHMYSMKRKYSYF